MPQHPLHHLRVRASGQPQRRRGVAQIVNAHIRHSGCHPGGPPADRPLPVRLPQRPAAWRSEQPGLRLLPRAPPVDDRHQLGHQRHRPGPVVLQRVHIQRAAALARQHGATQPQARTGHRYPVAGLETSQFAPAQPGQRQDRHDIAVRARAGSRERVQLSQGKRLPLPPDAAAGRPPDSCRHVVLDPAISHGEREDGAQRGQGTGRGRRGQATGNQAANPGRHLSGGDRGHRPVAETRPDVVTPVRLIALAGPALDQAAGIQPIGRHIRQRDPATAGISPLPKPQPPTLVLLPGDRVGPALKHASSDLAAMELHARPVPHRTRPQHIALHAHQATSVDSR